MASCLSGLVRRTLYSRVYWKVLAMPELPEVETMRRGIEPVVGARIERVRFLRNRFKPIAVTPSREVIRRRVAGCDIRGIERRGKRVLIRVSRDQSIIFEPRMTGIVLLADPPDREHLRVGFRLNHATLAWLWFWDRRGLGTIQLASDEQLDEVLGPNKLGPDALELSAPQLRERMRRSRRQIKVALLDQRVLAGVGNLYASEILHVAGVHPQQRCDRMGESQWRRIHRAVREVLEAAIRYEGSTLADGTYRNALNRAGQYQNHHQVYDRAGTLCARCGQAAIRRIVQAQRSTYFCPKCQTRR